MSVKVQNVFHKRYTPKMIEKQVLSTISANTCSVILLKYSSSVRAAKFIESSDQ